MRSVATGMQTMRATAPLRYRDVPSGDVEVGGKVEASKADIGVSVTDESEMHRINRCI